MIPFERALSLVLDAAGPLRVERVPLLDADGRFTAAPLRARAQMPRYDQSAMDGFAVRLVDVRGAVPGSPSELALDGDLPAGSRRRPTLRPGRTIKVFTGSPLPRGTEAVVMREYTRQRGDKIFFERGASREENIRRRGEEYNRGDLLLDRGAAVGPAAIGLLAGFGYERVPVFARPSITLVTIGDELVRLGRPLKPGMIYNSNEFSLTAALRRIGCGRIRAVTVRDDPNALRRRLARGLRESDVVLAAGGASVGDYDFVRPVAESLGIDERFRAIAVKPGKPVFFGTWRAPGRGAGTRLFFGLPGNAVSALVSLHQLVRPALRKMMGDSGLSELSLTAELTEGCSKRHGRLQLMRGRLAAVDGRLLVSPEARQGSHMMGGMAGADCLIHFPAGRQRLEAGESVKVGLISW
jgi:molybdopterin molybdotransferase